MDLNIDLQGLGELDAEAGRGTPLQLRLDDVLPDPDQPRKEFDQEKLRELADSIDQRGVKTPISVRPHPTVPGKYLINYGERRHIASSMAKRETIPAWIDEQHDDYDQVIENLKRDDLKPRELALFIQKRIALGDRKGDIATKLGKPAQVIAEYLALIEPPACVEQAYASGVRSPKTLYELRRLHEKHPEAVDAWCAAGVEITRKSVAVLGQQLSHDLEKLEVREPESALSHDLEPLAAPPVAPPVRQPSSGLSHDLETKPSGRQPRHETKPRAPAAPLASPNTPATLGRIMVEYQGRKASIDPASTVMLRYEDGESVQVALANLTVLPMVA